MVCIQYIGHLHFHICFKNRTTSVRKERFYRMEFSIILYFPGTIQIIKQNLGIYDGNENLGIYDGKTRNLGIYDGN